MLIIMLKDGFLPYALAIEIHGMTIVVPPIVIIK